MFVHFNNYALFVQVRVLVLLRFERSLPVCSSGSFSYNAFPIYHEYFK